MGTEVNNEERERLLKLQAASAWKMFWQPAVIGLLLMWSGAPPWAYVLALMNWYYLFRIIPLILTVDTFDESARRNLGKRLDRIEAGLDEHFARIERAVERN